MRVTRSTSSGFTLVEILVVIAIIAILTGILLPVTRNAMESAHQASCMTKLHQIAMAVKQYKLDEMVYPASLNDLGAYTQLSVTGGKATAGKDLLICPDDDTIRDTSHTNASIPYSSYYDKSGTEVLWNYWGYKDTGYAYMSDDPAYADAMTAAGITDPKKYPRMCNRFAPDNTIITHCTWHRLKTGRDEAQQLDIIVRLDGSAKKVRWKSYGDNNGWMTQPD